MRACSVAGYCMGGVLSAFNQQVLIPMLPLFKRVLVVAAHPDDEMLGCGGTLARLRALGVDVTLMLLGEGPAARDGADEQATINSRSSALAAASMLNIHDVRFGNAPDNQFDTLPLLELARLIERVAEETSPDIVFTHHSGDLNIDHVLTYRAVITAFRPLPGAAPPVLLGFEVLSSTEYSPPGAGPAFQPTLYIDIEHFLSAKQRALAAYSSEMRPWPHPRSHEAVECLARLRGSQCGREAAEAFVLYRGVV